MKANKVACVGAGIIGSSWATLFALKGCSVSLYDIAEPCLDKANKQIRNNLSYLMESDCISSDELTSIMDRITFTVSIQDALKDTQFIQESGPEKIEVKQAVIAQIDAAAPTECIVASSTSGLRITDIVKFSLHPERYIGAHPFNPPHLIPLVEITKGESTAKNTIERAVEFYRSVGKEPVVLKKEKIGFVANRLSHAVLREVMNLVNEGVCSVTDVDRALTYGPGLRWAAIGQVMVGDLGTVGGIREGTKRFAPLNEMIYRDLENRTMVPENWADVAADGIEQAKLEMPDCIGHTAEEIGAFRDKVLVTLLKLHGKM